MFEVRTWNVQVTTANIIDSFVVNQECAIRVLNGAVSRENCVIGFDYRSGDTRGRINRKLRDSRLK